MSTTSSELSCLNARVEDIVIKLARPNGLWTKTLLDTRLLWRLNTADISNLSARLTPLLEAALKVPNRWKRRRVNQPLQSHHPQPRSLFQRRAVVLGQPHTGDLIWRHARPEACADTLVVPNTTLPTTKIGTDKLHRKMQKPTTSIPSDTLTWKSWREHNTRKPDNSLKNSDREISRQRDTWTN